MTKHFIICRSCHGSGLLARGKTCSGCRGTGISEIVEKD